jgi:hypothetical protein
MTVQLGGAVLAAAKRAINAGGAAVGPTENRASPSSSPAISEIGSAGPIAVMADAAAGCQSVSTLANGVILSPRMSEKAVLRIMARSAKGLSDGPGVRSDAAGRPVQDKSSHQGIRFSQPVNLERDSL